MCSKVYTKNVQNKFQHVTFRTNLVKVKDFSTIYTEKKMWLWTHGDKKEGRYAGIYCMHFS